ncbi:hypothetical protein SNOG_03782 [Parastagonospora nodorum SN15]|uniref:Uncharacterized protein n=1 Tax=Phaeosphaeria nodorum (strain SN15 / ATCC MYA-4574 / FGSC 10173) TaxID=321614 RepID=Q0UWT2_PHANO|nr:hypothetical protein SNOG_03782 [Parastagonospora nodorum SN15]EAT88987.1 hypothetical protein SNOG_03782 [Parastagonospora nodorum SN15]
MVPLHEHDSRIPMKASSNRAEIPAAEPSCLFGMRRGSDYLFEGQGEHLKMFQDPARWRWVILYQTTVMPTSTYANAEAAESRRSAQQTQEHEVQRIMVDRVRLTLTWQASEKRGRRVKISGHSVAKLCVGGITSHDPARLEIFLEI